MKDREPASHRLEPLEAHRRLRSREVMALCGIRSKTTLWRWVREGKLPRPRYLAPRQPRWVFGEVLDALERGELRNRNK